MSLVMPEPIHNWTIDVGEWEFGILQFDPSGAYICYGPDSIDTNLSAYAILGTAVGSMAAFFVLIWFVTRLAVRPPAQT
jgi:hypothetical protein